MTNYTGIAYFSGVVLMTLGFGMLDGVEVALIVLGFWLIFVAIFGEWE